MMIPERLPRLFANISANSKFRPGIYCWMYSMHIPIKIEKNNPLYNFQSLGCNKVMGMERKKYNKKWATLSQCPNAFPLPGQSVAIQIIRILDISQIRYLFLFLMLLS